MEQKKEDRIPKPGEFYRHFKNKLYQIAAIAEHTETGEKLVIYQALYGDFRMYARPLAMFVSEVDHEKYPDAQQKYRFQRVCPEPGTLTGSEDGGQGTGAAESEIWQAADKAEQEPQVNPWLERFLDAEGYDRKLEALSQMRGKVGQKELDSLYLVLDIPQASGDADSQLRQIRKYLEMQKRYDGSRLR